MSRTKASEVFQGRQQSERLTATISATNEKQLKAPTSSLASAFLFTFTLSFSSHCSIVSSHNGHLWSSHESFNSFTDHLSAVLGICLHSSQERAAIYTMPVSQDHCDTYHIIKWYALHSACLLQSKGQHDLLSLQVVVHRVGTPSWREGHTTLMRP